MDWINYFIVSSTLAGASLVWRMLLLDHPTFDRFVEKIPVVGNALVCGFCFPMWLTFFTVLAINPLDSWRPLFVSEWPKFGITVVQIVFGWLTTGTAALFIRFLVVGLMDGSALISHQHKASHGEEG